MPFGGQREQRTGLMRPRSGFRGFTAIELLVTLAIVLIMCAMALPLVQSTLSYYQLQAAVAAVSGTIQSTRYQAISQGCSYKVAFTKTGSKYQISYQAIDANTKTCAAAYTDQGNAIPFSSSVTLGADATFQFNPGGGVAVTAGTVPLVLTSRNRTGTISVSNYGNVKVKYGP
jgi:type IV fimbrial biogenesis protein FimT